MCNIKKHQHHLMGVSFQQINFCWTSRTINIKVPTRRKTLSTRDTVISRNTKVGAPRSGSWTWKATMYKVDWSRPSGLDVLQVYCWPAATFVSWLTIWWLRSGSWANDPAKKTSRESTVLSHWTSGSGEPWTWHTALNPDCSLPSTVSPKIFGGAADIKTNNLSPSASGLNYYCFCISPTPTQTSATGYTSKKHIHVPLFNP